MDPDGFLIPPLCDLLPLREEVSMQDLGLGTGMFVVLLGDARALPNNPHACVSLSYYNAGCHS